MSDWSQGPHRWQDPDGPRYPPEISPEPINEPQSGAQEFRHPPVPAVGGTGTSSEPSPVTSFAEYQQTLAEATSVPELRKKNRRLKVILLLISVPIGLILLLIAGLIIVAALNIHDAQSASNRFLNDVQNNHAAAAYRLTTPAFRADYSEKQIAQYFARIFPLVQGPVKITHAEVGKASGEPDTAVVVYSLESHHGSQWLSVELQKNGNWQVLNFTGSDLPNDPPPGQNVGAPLTPTTPQGPFSGYFEVIPPSSYEGKQAHSIFMFVQKGDSLFASVTNLGTSGHVSESFTLMGPIVGSQASLSLQTMNGMTLSGPPSTFRVLVTNVGTSLYLSDSGYGTLPALPMRPITASQYESEIESTSP